MTVTIPASTVPAAYTYLLGAIKSMAGADSLFSEMMIRVGEPGRNLPNDGIVIGRLVRTVVPESFIGSGGQFWLNESYDIFVTCSSWLGSGDSDDTSLISTQVVGRVFDLVGYVESAVRTDPSLGGLVNQAYPAASESEGPAWTDNPTGLICEVIVPVHIDVLN